MFKKLFLVLFVFNVWADCPFCDPEVIANQKYGETSQIWGLYNNRPAVKGHCLIVPKRHVEEFKDLTPEEILEIYELVCKTHLAVQNVQGPVDFRLIMNSGPHVGRILPHLYFHFVPNGVGSLWFQIKFFTTYPFRRLLNDEELSKTVKELAQALEKY